MTYLRDNSYYRRRAGFFGSDGARALFIVLVVIGVYILSWLVLTPASGPLQSFFYPLAKINNLTNDQLSGVSSFFAFRNTLVAEKRQLELDNAKLKLEIERYKILEQENQDLRNLRGAEDTRTALVGKIIAKPPHIPYDILLLDVGLKNSPTLAGGRLVFAEKDIVLGYIASVSTNSSKVLLYSSAGQKLPVVIGSSALPAIASGQGLGNFSVQLPRGVEVAVGDPVRTSLVGDYLLGVVSQIYKDPNQPYQKILIKSPVSLTTLKWVEIPYVD